MVQNSQMLYCVISFTVCFLYSSGELFNKPESAQLFYRYSEKFQWLFKYPRYFIGNMTEPMTVDKNKSGNQ